jgi:diaminopimelate decarboxylase
VALRVNPDVKTETHPYIQTGFRDNKFGLDFTEMPDLLVQLKNTQHVRLVGLTLHIGSQIRDIKPFEIAIQKALDLYASIEAQGFALESFDVGGGIGIDYAHQDITKDEELIKEYGELLNRLVPKKIKNLILEPGRILVARFGRLVTKVQYVKRTPFKNFIVVDAGMNHLIRPALYEAFHHIELVRKTNAQKEIFDVVGPIWGSSDVLGFDRYLPGDIQEGDMLIVHDAGAYGAVMMSDYNLRPRAAELADANLAKIIFEEK